MSERIAGEVWHMDRCVGCGLCVATCSKGILYWDGEASHPLRETRQKRIGLTEIPLDTCSFCQAFCEETCPRLHSLEGLPARRIASAKATGPIRSAEPMEVIRALLVANLSVAAIDGVIANGVDGWALQPQAKVMTSVEELADNLAVQGLWVPTLDVLNEAVYERKLRDIAVVGTPCVAEAIRTLNGSGNERLDPYRRTLRVSIATFCTGAYHPEAVGQYLEDRMGISLRDVGRVQSSPREKQLRVVLSDGSLRTVPLASVEGYTRPGCATCEDLLGESADIAVGSLGARDGYCTLIVRTEPGETCLQNAVDLGLVEVVDEYDDKALRAAQLDKGRRDRAQAFDDLMLLMLDALRDPQKGVEVRDEFVRLYEIDDSTETVREEARHGACAQCSGC